MEKENKENKERYGIIYKITNTVNGKCYIGQTTNGFNKRYRRKGVGIERVYKYHKSNKDGGRYYIEDLLNDIDKYGFDCFDVEEEFDIAYNQEDLDTLEKKYILEFNCIDNGYNKEDGGSNGKPSIESCKKMSESHKGKCVGKDNPMYGKTHSEESRKKISNALNGRTLSEDHKKKLSEAFKGENNPMYGKEFSEEHKRKIRENHADFSGEKHPMYGKHHSKESREKMSIAARRENLSADTIKKMSEAKKGANNHFYGKPRSDEDRKKISESLKGRKFSDDHRRKLSDARKGKYSGGNSPSAKKIICINDNHVFNTGKECAEYYKKDITTIRSVCKHRRKQTRDGLRFMYYDEYIQQQEKQDQTAI